MLWQEKIKNLCCDQHKGNCKIANAQQPAITMSRYTAVTKIARSEWEQEAVKDAIMRELQQ
jgi:hypothetical protein